MNEAVILLTHYGFEITGYTIEELIETWLISYQSVWIRFAIIEALYQGRYKAISVEQILIFWQKRGNPTYHFTKEFERLICKNITQLSDQKNAEENPEITPQTTEEKIEIEIKDQSNLNQEISYNDEIELKNNQIKFIDQIAEQPPILKADYSDLKMIYYPFPNQPIHKFVPPLDSSQFFLRLKEFIDPDQLN